MRDMSILNPGSRRRVTLAKRYMLCLPDVEVRTETRKFFHMSFWFVECFALGLALNLKITQPASLSPTQDPSD